MIFAYHLKLHSLWTGKTFCIGTVKPSQDIPGVTRKQQGLQAAVTGKA